jgi:hypothetical protein
MSDPMHPPIPPVTMPILLGLALTLVAVLGLGFVESASATVTATQITSPAGPTFTAYDENNPNTIAVTGTTDSTNPALDKVDIDCFHGTEHPALALEVPLAADGSFSLAAGELQNIAYNACRLRAVPTGAVPAELGAFAGPLVAVGFRRLESYTRGPAVGSPYGFFLHAQGATAAADYSALGRCGLSGAYLLDESLERTATTFACDDAFFRYDDFDNPGASTRSQMQVDGSNAYNSHGIDEMFGSVEHFPDLTFSSTENPLNGDVTITDSEPLVTCQSGEYPPSSGCQPLVSTGVRDVRTIEQGDDGHLVVISDRFASTDSQAHNVDLEPQNFQSFSSFSSENGEAIGYRFPGQATYSVHPDGQVVPFADSQAGTIYVRVEGSSDGDHTTGRGAIVFDSPASPATFDEVNSEYSGFHFHQTVAVPAGGSTTVRFAYVQAYRQSEVEALAGQQEAAWGSVPATSTAPASPAAARPAPAGPAPGKLPSSNGLAPSNLIHLGTVTIDRRTGTARLPVAVTAAGKLTLRSRQLKGIGREVRAPGTETLLLRPTGIWRALLRKRGRVVARFKLTFHPSGGTAGTAAGRANLEFHKTKMGRS